MHIHIFYQNKTSVKSWLRVDGKGLKTLILMKGFNKELTVSDSGTGIEPQHLPHIFERFYKSEKARSFVVQGNGLGLALVEEMVQAYGGIIDVQSVVGRGTKFIIRFS